MSPSIHLACSRKDYNTFPSYPLFYSYFCFHVHYIFLLRLMYLLYKVVVIIVGGIFEVLVVWLIVASGEGGWHLLSGQWTAE